jgi:hypothetical protein
VGITASKKRASGFLKKGSDKRDIPLKHLDIATHQTPTSKDCTFRDT